MDVGNYIVHMKHSMIGDVVRPGNFINYA